MAFIIKPPKINVGRVDERAKNILDPRTLGGAGVPGSNPDGSNHDLNNIVGQTGAGAKSEAQPLGADSHNPSGYQKYTPEGAPGAIKEGLSDKLSDMGGSGTSSYTPFTIPDAPNRGAYQDYRNSDGTLQSQLTAAGKYRAYTPEVNAKPSSANFFSATGGPASAASLAAAGKAQNYLTDRATQIGPSAWLNLQLQNQDLAKSNALGNAVSAAGGQNAAARSSLATKGGLSSGAAERIAKTGNQDLTLQKQSILNQDRQSRLNLGAQDEATKTGLLGQASSLESGLSQFNAGQNQQNTQFNLGQANQLAQFNTGARNQNAQYNASNAQQNDQFNINASNASRQYNAGQLANANQFDIGNALNEGVNKRNDDLAYYQEQMRDRAAAINANAIGTTGAGKKSGV